MGIVAGDGRIDLHRHTQIFQITEASNGSIECAGNTAEAVGRKRVSPVQTDGDATDAAVDDHLRDLPGNQRAIRGQRYAQTLVCAISRQLEDIRPEEWLTSAQHQDGSGNLGNLIDDIACSLGGEIIWRT